jgi:hypothetical protein
MKALGIKQFHQKSFKLLPVAGSEFAGILGHVPMNFIAVIYGHSGNGKTEFSVRLAKFLCQFGKVAWMSYEQGHGLDLQMATKRNNMDDVTGQFIPIDPNEKRALGVSYLEDLDKFLKKRSAPQFIFIDSLDYTGFHWDDYLHLKHKHKKKTFIFIAHSSRTGTLKKDISDKIKFDGHIGIHVSKYIATPDKNRFGGFEPYVIWEEKAREMNPLFFTKKLARPKGTKKKALKPRKK